MEVLVASSISIFVVMLAYSFMATMHRSIDSEMVSLPAEQMIDLLLLELGKELQKGHAYYWDLSTNAYTGSTSIPYTGYPPYPIDDSTGTGAWGSVTHPTSCPAGANACPPQNAAPCEGVAIWKPYPNPRRVSPPAPANWPTNNPPQPPRLSTFTTICVDGGDRVDYSQTPSWHEGETDGNGGTGPYGGIHCDGTQKKVPQVVFNSWFGYPKTLLPSLPANTTVPFAPSGPPDQIVGSYPPTPIGSAYGVTMCAKFLRDPNASTHILYLLAEVTALYRVGGTFKAVHKSQAFSLDSGEASVTPGILCPLPPTPIGSWVPAAGC